ncbi:hypothetical protein AYI70_g8401 [Smittium culicis]|uniref:Uncharacterized protein n=1 Tax=Smittium culicis TaxID=133412 RepID=A0A1R1XG30_9FUNG|nr:hypothetical protein AYI70_g8401 [Smittium culicis]
MNALYKFAHDLDGCIYIRKDDHRARITYLIFSKKDDSENDMQNAFSHNLKEIEMYQTEKLQEDITVVDIPNLGDVDILTLLDLIKETIEPISEIIDISALCRKGLTEFLPYGVKILLRKKSADTIILNFLDYENRRINIFNRGCASDADVEPNGQLGADKPSIVNQEPRNLLASEQRRGNVGMKRPPPSSKDILEARKTENEKALICEQIQKNSLGQNSASKEHGKKYS